MGNPVLQPFGSRGALETLLQWENLAENTGVNKSSKIFIARARTHFDLQPLGIYQWAWLGKRKQTPQNCPPFFTDQWKNIKPHYLNARTFFFLPDLFRKYHSSCRTIPKNILSKSIPRPPQLYHPGFKIDHIPNFSNFQTPPAPGELSNPDPGRDPIKCFRAAFSGNILGQNNSAQKLRPKTQHRA